MALHQKRFWQLAGEGAGEAGIWREGNQPGVMGENGIAESLARNVK